MTQIGVTNSNKELSTTQINCGDSFKIRLSLSAEPDIVDNPTDIVLILDRSGSMSEVRLQILKAEQKLLLISLMNLLTEHGMDK